MEANSTDSINRSTGRQTHHIYRYAVVLFLCIPVLFGVVAISSRIRSMSKKDKFSEKARHTATASEDSPEEPSLIRNNTEKPSSTNHLPPRNTQSRLVHSDQLDSHRRMFTSYSSSMSGTPMQPLAPSHDITNSSSAHTIKSSPGPVMDVEDKPTEKVRRGLLSNVNMTRWLSAPPVNDDEVT